MLFSNDWSYKLKMHVYMLVSTVKHLVLRVIRSAYIKLITETGSRRSKRHLCAIIVCLPTENVVST